VNANWLNYVTAFGSIATPVIVLILTAIGWRYRVRLERKIELENKLRENRIGVYNQILEPFIILLTSDEAWKSDPKNRNRDKYQCATQIMLSLEYRKTGFQLSLLGSDSVIRAYNDLMQYFFQGNFSTPATSGDVRSWMSLLGQFLLEIRKSMGNEGTNLDNWEMLEWFVNDARTYRNPKTEMESKRPRLD